jgi:hypothetical protein
MMMWLYFRAGTFPSPKNTAVLPSRCIFALRWLRNGGQNPPATIPRQGFADKPLPAFCLFVMAKCSLFLEAQKNVFKKYPREKGKAFALGKNVSLQSKRCAIRSIFCNIQLLYRTIGAFRLQFRNLPGKNTAEATFL